MTTQTSSLSSVRLAAFCDELEKIAEEVKPPESKKEKAKLWAKRHLPHVAGAGAAVAASMLADKYLTPRLGPGWRALHPVTRNMIGTAIIGGGGLAAGALANKLRKEKEELK